MTPTTYHFKRHDVVWGDRIYPDAAVFDVFAFCTCLDDSQSIQIQARRAAMCLNAFIILSGQCERSTFHTWRFRHNMGVVAIPDPPIALFSRKRWKKGTLN
jgi:hypothetical protein